MLTFEKDGAKKILDEESKLIPVLEKAGWELVAETKEVKATKDSKKEK